MLPQLDFSHYTSQIFWLVICFCILITAMKKNFIPKMNAMIKKREETIASGNIKLEALKNEREDLEKKITETNKDIVLNVANILNEVDTKYKKLLSEQLNNLKREHEEVIRQLRMKYTEDIRAIAKVEADKIGFLSELALPKLSYKEKRL